jgi:hypothetical protein
VHKIDKTAADFEKKHKIARKDVKKNSIGTAPLEKSK